MWIEGVARKLNPADPPPPSRGCVWCVNKFCVETKRREVPSVFARILHSVESLKNSQFVAPSAPEGFSPAWVCPSAMADSQYLGASPYTKREDT